VRALALVVQDLQNVPAFAAALKAAHDMSKFFMGSSKRLEALEKYTKLVPVMMSNTRFASAMLVCQRMVQLSSALSLMHAKVAAGEPLFNGEFAVDAVKTVEAFKAHYTVLLQHMSVIEGLARLGKPFLGIIARIGSDTEYTSSITQEATRSLFKACEEERIAHPYMAAICLSLQNSLLERTASVGTCRNQMVV